MSKTNIFSTPSTPPTSFLPPLKQLYTTSTTQISLALNTLRSLYFPPTPPPLPKRIVIPKRSAPTLSNRNGLSSVPDSGYASATDEQEDMDDDEVEAWERPEKDEVELLEILRADGFERAFAIKWLTGFIARCDMWIESGEDDDGVKVEVGREAESGFAIEWESIRRSKLIEDATTILSLFSTDKDENDLSGGNVTRSFNFPTPLIHLEQIKIELNDEPVSNRDHTSVGLQSWASSILLAKKMASSPSTFLPPLSMLFDQAKPLRVLELGAGTGLLSIVTAKILQNESTTNEPVANTIVATDYHPDVLENLKKNVQTNFANLSSPFLPPSSSSSFAKSKSSLPIEVNYLDWANPHFDTPLDARFDVILAADVIYHPDHARWIKNCVEKYLQLPTRNDGGVRIGSKVTGGSISGSGGIFWLMIAVRSTGRHEGLDISVDECFQEEICDGPRLIILEREEVVKQRSYGRADEGGYRLFKIGWDNRS